jgi:hypothetical protein
LNPPCQFANGFPGEQAFGKYAAENLPIIGVCTIVAEQSPDRLRTLTAERPERREERGRGGEHPCRQGPSALQFAFAEAHNFSGGLRDGNSTAVALVAIITRPDLPRSLACLIVQGLETAQDGSLSLRNIVASVATWVFPQPLPPFTIVAVIIGGQSGKIYTTKWKIRGLNGAVVAEKPGPDVPFTAQLFRLNVFDALQQISLEPLVTGPGIYNFDLYIQDELIASTPLRIDQIPQPPAVAIPPGDAS